MYKNIFDEALADIKSIRDLTENSVKEEIIEKLTPQIRALVEKHVLTDVAESEDAEESTSASAKKEEKPVPGKGTEKKPTDKQQKPISEIQFIGIPALSPTTANDESFYSSGEVDETLHDKDKPYRSSHTLKFSSLTNQTQFLAENYCSDIIELTESIRTSIIPSHKKIKTALVKIQEARKNLVKEKNMSLATKKIIESVLNDCFSQINNVGNISESSLVLKNIETIQDEDSDNEYVIDLAELDLDMPDNDVDDEFDLEEEDEEEELKEEKIFAEFNKKNTKNRRNEMSKSKGRSLSDLNENTVLEIDDRDLMRALREMAEKEELEEDAMYEEELEEGDSMHEEEEDLDEGWMKEEEEMMSSEPEAGAVDDMSGMDMGAEEVDPVADLVAQAETLTPDQVADLVAQLQAKQAEMTAPADSEMGEVQGSTSTATTLESRFNYYKNLYMEAKTGSREETKYLNVLKDLASRMSTSQKQRLISESSSNRTTEDRSTTNNTQTQMKQKLAESNLLNTKLLYTNRLLQNDSLTNRQKTKIIEKIDEAKSEREVRLVFESVDRLVSDTKTQRQYDSRVIGSSSATTQRSSANTLNENYETDRWAKLAGILK